MAWSRILPALRCLAQQARQVRKMDREGQGRDPTDPAFRALGRCQRGPVPASCGAHNLCDFRHKIATPRRIEYLSLTNLKEKRIKNGAKIVSNGRCVHFRSRTSTARAASGLC
jgi:hypothetical protein